jgi:hypothetical protein
MPTVLQRIETPKIGYSNYVKQRAGKSLLSEKENKTERLVKELKAGDASGFLTGFDSEQAWLGLLEENKIKVLKNLLQEGIDSGIAENFNPEKHLESLKAKKEK